MTLDDRGEGGRQDFLFTTSPITRCPQSHAAGLKLPLTPQSRRPLRLLLGLFYNCVLSKCVSGRPEASISLLPCLFTPFQTRLIPDDGLFTVGDPCAARASHKAKRRRRSLLSINKNKDLRIAMEPIGAVRNYTRPLIHSVKCGEQYTP